MATVAKPPTPRLNEEESVICEILEHPTRDDVHEQREALQECEGVIHAPAIAMRPHEPHGFDCTSTRVTTTVSQRTWRIRWRVRRQP